MARHAVSRTHLDGLSPNATPQSSRKNSRKAYLLMHPLSRSPLRTTHTRGSHVLLTRPFERWDRYKDPSKPGGGPLAGVECVLDVNWYVFVWASIHRPIDHRKKNALIIGAIYRKMIPLGSMSIPRSVWHAWARAHSLGRNANGVALLGALSLVEWLRLRLVLSLLKERSRSQEWLSRK